MPIQAKPIGQGGFIYPLIHSLPKVGKTQFIGSGGHDFKICIVHPPTDHMESIIGSGCDEIVADDWADMAEVSSMMQHEGDKYDWWWLDTISLWQDSGLRDVYGDALDRAGAPGNPARKHRESFGPDKGEYQTNMLRISEFVAHAVGCRSFNFGITAHSVYIDRPGTDIQDEDDDGMQIQPWIQGRGMISKISGYMNVVGYMEIRKSPTGKSYRLLHTNGTSNILAGCQFAGAFGEDGYLIDPTLPKFVEKINAVRTQSAKEGSARTSPRAPARRPTRGR